MDVDEGKPTSIDDVVLILENCPITIVIRNFLR